MTESEVLRVHTETVYGALKSQDLVVLDRLYSDMYMLVRSDGSVLNKSQVLQDLRDQGLKFQSIDLWQEHVPLFDSAAILTGESRTVASRNGTKTRSHFRLVAAYAKEDTAIRLIHFQSTYLPD
jgi:hypothetical protein